MEAIKNNDEICLLFLAFVINGFVCAHHGLKGQVRAVERYVDSEKEKDLESEFIKGSTEPGINKNK